MSNVNELDELREQLKKLIVEALSLEDIEPDEIADDEALFGSGLGLDSLDAVEIYVMLQRNFGIEIKNTSDAKNIFYSIDSLAKYVQKHRKK
ncbi:MAG: acyl carrier protein [Victivallales bacterium]|nr:acyl carrier protein [Victivallales bacterium]